jgi:hypothetical protein
MTLLPFSLVSAPLNFPELGWVDWNTVDSDISCAYHASRGGHVDRKKLAGDHPDLGILVSALCQNVDVRREFSVVVQK